MADDSKGNDGENDGVNSIHESIESGANLDFAQHTHNNSIVDIASPSIR